MSTTHGTTWLERTSISTRHVPSFIWKYWDAFQERRERQKLRATLSGLSDRELADIGTARCEIDYIASHRGIDARNAILPPRTSGQSRGSHVIHQRR